MGYKVRARTEKGLRWLAYGMLKTRERYATYYSHPSAARKAAQNYLLKTGAKHPMDIIVEPSGALYEYVRLPVPLNASQLQITINIDPMKGGGFHVWSREASADFYAEELASAVGGLAKDWAEQVECDL